MKTKLVGKFVVCLLFAACLSLPAMQGFAQSGVAINTTGASADPSAMLDVNSTSQGVLISRMTTQERDNIVNPANGLQIYNLDCNNINFNAGTPSAPNWVTVNSSNTLIAGVTIAANPNGAICAGTAVTFTATPSQNGLSPSYQWKVNGVIVSGQTNIMYTTSSLANGDVVTCELSSSVNCVTGSPATSNSITVLVNPALPASVGIAANPSGAMCAGTSVTFTATPANGGASPTYQWKKGGADIVGETSSTYSTTGLVNGDAITCVVNSNLLCVTGSPATSNTLTMTVNSLPVSTFTPTSGQSPITFTANTSGATYSWTFQSGSPASSSTQSQAVTWSSSGTYNVSLTVTANGCSSATTIAVPVTVGPVVTTFNFTGGSQTFTVPGGVTSITIEAYGAQGGGASGGQGGYATGNLSVTPGQTLYVYVGGQGTTGTSGITAGGYNGGGNGSWGSAGGGASDVRNGGTALSNRVIVAGGGGGMYGSAGGSGGGTTGGNGSSEATGGTQSAGGLWCGALGVGGSNPGGLADGGGGGGGYYGGGANRCNAGGSNGSGAGGSGYIGGVSGGSMSNGGRSGHGQVIISW